MPRKTERKSLLKPSGYGVVIRNRNAIQAINRKLRRLKEPSDRDPLMLEKDRLIDEMQAACPHESMVHCGAVKHRFGPETRPMRFCISCGCSEFGPRPYEALKRRPGRVLKRMNPQDFAAKLGATLRWTGIDLAQR